MDENLYLFVIPVATSLALMPVRRRRPLYWWMSLSVVGALILLAILTVGRDGGSAEEVLGAVTLYLLPLVLMFLVLRANLFARRIYLIPLLGPLIYLLGVGLSLSVVVTLGLLQP